VDFPAPSQVSSARHEKELMGLRDLSTRLGGDPLLVQASNGNTSIKLDGILWVKSSGKWLSRAMQEEMFVPLELAPFKASMRNAPDFDSLRVPQHELRPSIETPMHAVIPHQVVIHVHSINAITWAVRLDARDQLKERLHALHWQWIPYAASGLPLAHAIASAVMRAPDTDVFILGNHGLVVCGSDCDSVELLLRDVERRLAISPRPFPKPATNVLSTIVHSSSWQFPDDDSVHALSTDEVTRRILKGGVLYPCQAIFLGRSVPLLSSTCLASEYVAPFGSKDATPPFIAVEGTGVLLNNKISSEERATLLGLAQVAQRTDKSAKLRYLDPKEIANILDAGVYSSKDAPPPAE